LQTFSSNVDSHSFYKDAVRYGDAPNVQCFYRGPVCSSMHSGFPLQPGATTMSCWQVPQGFPTTRVERDFHLYCTKEEQTVTVNSSSNGTERRIDRTGTNVNAVYKHCVPPKCPLLSTEHSKLLYKSTVRVSSLATSTLQPVYSSQLHRQDVSSTTPKLPKDEQDKSQPGGRNTISYRQVVSQNFKPASTSRFPAPTKESLLIRENEKNKVENFTRAQFGLAGNVSPSFKTRTSKKAPPAPALYTKGFSLKLTEALQYTMNRALLNGETSFSRCSVSRSTAVAPRDECRLGSLSALSSRREFVLPLKEMDLPDTCSTASTTVPSVHIAKVTCEAKTPDVVRRVIQAGKNGPLNRTVSIKYSENCKRPSNTWVASHSLKETSFKCYSSGFEKGASCTGNPFITARGGTRNVVAREGVSKTQIWAANRFKWLRKVTAASCKQTACGSSTNWNLPKQEKVTASSLSSMKDDALVAEIKSVMDSSGAAFPVLTAPLSLATVLDVASSLWAEEWSLARKYDALDSIRKRR